MSDSRAEEFVKRYDTLKSGRGLFESMWQETTNYIAPWRTDFIRKSTPGEKRGQSVLDVTATFAADNLSAAIGSTVSNPAQNWFNLRHELDNINDDYQARRWLESSDKKIYNKFSANGQAYYNEMTEFNLDQVLYGTAILYIEELPGGNIFYSVRSLAECVIDHNDQEIIDVCIRSFKFKARQAIVKWDNTVSEDIKKAAEKEPDREFEFLHVAVPRNDYLPRRLDAKGKPYASFYIEKEKRVVLRESGYHFFPYTVGRWNKIPGSPYGVGPGQKTLPEVKMLQAMSSTALTAAEFAARPPILAPDEMGFRGLKLRPGAIVYGGMENGQRQYDLLQTGANHGLTEEMMKQRREAVREGFHASLLLMVDRNNMTATEVMQRQQENMRLLAPYMARHMAEVEDPNIDKTFDILARNGLLDEPPDILKDYPNLKVEYVSPMARAQRATEAMAIQKTLAELEGFGAVDPSVYQNFNGDKMARAIAEINGVPTEIMRDPKEVEATRQQAAQQEAAAQAAASVPAMAGAGKDMAMAEKASAEAAAA